MALCKRCGEEIALANDLDRARDIDRRRHLVMAAGTSRRLSATHWQIFILLYSHRGDVVYADRIQAELYRETKVPEARNIIREHVSPPTPRACGIALPDRKLPRHRIRADRRRCR